MKAPCSIILLCIIGASAVQAQTNPFSFNLVLSSQNAIRTTGPVASHKPDFMQISSFGVEVAKPVSERRSITLGLSYGYRRFFSQSMYDKHTLFGELDERADYVKSFAYHTIEVPLTLSNSWGSFKGWTTSWDITALGSANLSGTYFDSPNRVGKYSTGFTPFAFSLFSELSFKQEVFNQLTFGIHPNIRLMDLTKGDSILSSFSQPSVHFINSVGIRLSVHYGLF